MSLLKKLQQRLSGAETDQPLTPRQAREAERQKLLAARRAAARKRAKAKEQPEVDTTTYRAVEVVFPDTGCCRAVRDQAGSVYLAARAPKLPLEGCQDVLHCRCRYEHRKDRRALLRRDSDHGLPERFYDGDDRRDGPPRRRRSGSLR